MQADETVLSEVHMETCPPAAPGTTWSTRFLFSIPPNTEEPLHAPSTDPASPGCASDSSDSSRRGPTIDSDGDLVLNSRPRRRQHSITIRHSLATTISRCGEQVWQGACLLGDWVLANRQQLQGQVVVELGAGVGLVSLLAGMFAQTVFLTDADAGALQLAQRNLAEAAASVAHWPPRAAGQECCAQAADICIRALDWFQLFDTQLQQLSQAEVLQLLNSTPTCADRGPSAASAAGAGVEHTLQQRRQQQPQQQDVQDMRTSQQQQQQQEPEQQRGEQGVTAGWRWTPSDLQLLAQTTLWLAADVVYDQTLTDAFMHAAAALMRWQLQQQQQQHARSLHCQCTQHQPPANAPEAGTPAAPPSAAAAAAACGTSTTPQPHPPVQPKLIVALEKRYNFTLRDMDAAAPAFDHFMSYIQPSEGSLASLPAQEQQRLRQQQQQQLCACLFKGQRIDVDSVPQALQYDRSSEYLELWELTLLT